MNARTDGYKARSKEADIAFGMGRIQAHREDEAVLQRALAEIHEKRERSRRANQQRESAA